MTQEFDVIVIGGGATGGGTALDLALRGLRVALIERADLTDGTSGRYHGLLHSGGRYAVRDAESARECIEENRILRKIAPHTIEATGGLFVQTPADDPAYADKWAAACRTAGIETEEISVGQMLKDEPALNPAITRAFRVPDASADGFDLLTALGAAVKAHGGTVLTYHEVVSLELATGAAGHGAVTGVTVRNKRTGETRRLSASLIVNAAGAWAGQIAAMAGCPLTVRPSKGTMIAMAYRFVNTVINRLHAPGDGDILVPVGTVAVIGTTSVNVPNPDDTSIEPWEVRLMLEEGEKLVPGFSQARALRAWAGVRPLYEEGKATEGREAKRTFAVLDHSQRDGVKGLITVVGGKFTTYRLMAERAADMVCGQLGVSVPCTTKDTVLPDARLPFTAAKPHWLGHRLHEIEKAKAPAEAGDADPTHLRVRNRHAVRVRAGRTRPCRHRCAVGARRPAPRPAAGDGAVPGRLLRLPCGRHLARDRPPGCGPGHRGAGRLRPTPLEGPAAAAVGAGPAPGAARRANLSEHSWVEGSRLKVQGCFFMRMRLHGSPKLSGAP